MLEAQIEHDGRTMRLSVVAGGRGRILRITTSPDWSKCREVSLQRMQRLAQGWLDLEYHAMRAVSDGLVRGGMPLVNTLNQALVDKVHEFARTVQNLG